MKPLVQVLCEILIGWNTLLALALFGIVYEMYPMAHDAGCGWNHMPCPPYSTSDLLLTACAPVILLFFVSTAAFRIREGKPIVSLLLAALPTVLFGGLLVKIFFLNH